MINDARELWKQIILKGIQSDANFVEKLSLQPGAKDEDFELLQQKLGLLLPEEVKDFYRVHNGQIWKVGSASFVRNLTLSTITKIIEDWNFLNEEFDSDGIELEIDPEIKPCLWNNKWIPIADNGAGDYLCVDTDPTNFGIFGQMLYFYHDWGNRSVEAKNLFEFVNICINEDD